LELTIDLKKEVHEGIEDLAIKNGISTSDAINYALSDYFQLLEGEEEE
jgi:hypothetical protein